MVVDVAVTLPGGSGCAKADKEKPRNIQGNKYLIREAMV